MKELTILEQVVPLANVPNFLEETGACSTYGECHAALTWLSIQIKRAHIPTYTIYLCVGVFAGKDHSWMQIEDVYSGEYTLIDMTVDQFGKFDVPYVGPMSPGYVIHDSILLSDEAELPAFIEGLG